jgi:hypothetical protein
VKLTVSLPDEDVDFSMPMPSLRVSSHGLQCYTAPFGCSARAN